MATTKRTRAPKVQTGDPANLRRDEDGTYTDVTDAERIAELEDEGLTTSDAQAVLDAEAIEPKAKPARRKGQRRTAAEMVAEGMAKVPKEGKASADRPPCLCGCGGIPKGPKARFLPGHDARFHSAQRKASAESSKDA